MSEVTKAFIDDNKAHAQEEFSPHTGAGARNILTTALAAAAAACAAFAGPQLVLTILAVSQIGACCSSAPQAAARDETYD